jgi:hypothetical protein
MTSRKAKLEKIRRKAQEELWKIEQAETDAKNKKMIGRHFRYDNSYGSSTRWWLYSKVISLKDGNIITLEFQTTSAGEIKINPSREHYRNMHSGFDLITKREFEAEWAKVQQAVTTISTAERH